MKHTHKHTHPFNSPLSRTTRVIQYQKGKTNVDFTEARDSEWQWHQLGHMKVCTSLQTNNHASTRPGHHSVFTGRMPFLPPNQQCQSTEGKILVMKERYKPLSTSSLCGRLTNGLLDTVQLNGRNGSPITAAKLSTEFTDTILPR